jgi:hypothetical protein
MKSLANEKNALLDGHFLFQRFRFHLEPNVPLHMPAYNKGNVIRGGRERVSADREQQLAVPDLVYSTG